MLIYRNFSVFCMFSIILSSANSFRRTLIPVAQYFSYIHTTRNPHITNEHSLSSDGAYLLIYFDPHPYPSLYTHHSDTYEKGARGRNPSTTNG